MAVRTKGRAKFIFRGRHFVWYVADDRWLRIASADKRFSVSCDLLREWEVKPLLKVSGPEFPRLQESRRPIDIEGPVIASATFGAIVEKILCWCFQRD